MRPLIRYAWACRVNMGNEQGTIGSKDNRRWLVGGGDQGKGFCRDSSHQSGLWRIWPKAEAEERISNSLKCVGAFSLLFSPSWLICEF